MTVGQQARSLRIAVLRSGESGLKMQYLTKRSQVDLPAVGVELHAVVWLLEQWKFMASDYPELASVYDTVEPWMVYDCRDPFEIWAAIIDALMDECSANGGYLPRFSTGIDPWSIFSSEGHCIEHEFMTEESSIYELVTAESRDVIQLIDSKRLLEQRFREAVSKADIPVKAVAATGPPTIPRQGRIAPFTPGGLHINVELPQGSIPQEGLDLISSILASLVALLGPGGLHSGFCHSPMGAYADRNLRANRFVPAPYKAIEKTSNVLSEPPMTEPRLHVIVDNCSDRSVALLSGLLQVMIAMLYRNKVSYRLRMVNPTLACRRWSHEPEARCRLFWGGTTDAWSLMDAFRNDLSRFVREFALTPLYERLVELMSRSIGVAVASKGSDESTLGHALGLDFWRKRSLYRRIAGEVFGISLARFDVLATALHLLGIPPNLVVEMSADEIRRRATRSRLIRHSKLISFLRENRIGWKELAPAASLWQALVRCELMMTEVYPGEPLYSKEEKEAWDEFTRGLEPDPGPTRGEARARFVEAATVSSCDNSRLAMDFNNLYSFPRCGAGEMLEVLVVPLMSARDSRTGEIMRFRFRDESEMDYALAMYPEASLYSMAFKEVIRLHDNDLKCIHREELEGGYLEPPAEFQQNDFDDSQDYEMDLPLFRMYKLLDA
ncbi:MAG: hypothetical protein KJ907_10925 [Actinobacteria bacterium]|nr:hypothetical protein [Actinomycetota bacterium]